VPPALQKHSTGVAGLFEELQIPRPLATLGMTVENKLRSGGFSR
jgi:hypothetical protein